MWSFKEMSDRLINRLLSGHRHPQVRHRRLLPHLRQEAAQNPGGNGRSLKVMPGTEMQV